jgi:hypothetical protein
MDSGGGSQQASSLSRISYGAYLAGVVVFLYLRTFLLPRTPLAPYGDEIHYFLHAVRMLHGQVPYRDFFTFVPPGADLLYLSALRLFGVHAWVFQGIIVALGFFLTCAILWVSASIFDGSLALLPGLLFLVFDLGGALDATHHWWCALFVLMAVGILLGGRSKKRLAVAGMLCGVATLFTHTQGGLSLVAIGLYVLWTPPVDEKRADRVRELGALVLPFVVVVGLLAGYYASRVGLHTLLYWTVYFPLRYFSTLEAHTPRAYFLGMPKMKSVGDVLTAAPYMFVHLLVPLMYVLCLIRLFRERRDREEQRWQHVLLINLVGLAMFASVVSAPTPLRLCVVAPPAVILCVWYFGPDTRLDGWVRRGLWTAALLLMVYLPINRQLHPRRYIDLPMGRTAFLDPREYDQIEWYAARTRPGDSFFGDPTAAFLLSLESPSSLDYVTVSAFTRPQQIQELIDSLEKHRTRYVDFYRELNDPPGPDDNLGPLREYIAQNYHLAKESPAGRIWERN